MNIRPMAEKLADLDSQQFPDIRPVSQALFLAVGDVRLARPAKDGGCPQRGPRHSAEENPALPIPHDAIATWRDRLTREWNARIEREQPPTDELTARHEYLLLALATYAGEERVTVADLAKVTYTPVADVNRALGTLRRLGLLPGEPLQ